MSNDTKYTLHTANADLQAAADEYSRAKRGAVTGRTFVFAGAGSSERPVFVSIHAGQCGTPLVVGDDVQSRVQVDPRMLRIAKVRKLGLSLRGLAATLDFSAQGLCTLHEEDAIPLSKCRNGIPRSEASSGKAKQKFDIRPTMETPGVTSRRNKAGQVVGFNPVDPTCPHLVKFADALGNIAKKCHGLTMRDEHGNELTIAAYTEVLIKNVIAGTKKKSEAAKKSNAAPSGGAEPKGDASNEQSGTSPAVSDPFSGVPARVLTAYKEVNGDEPKSLEEVMSFVCEACEFYQISLAEGAQSDAPKAKSA
jgi:hypothetical protein